ncbi:MAG: hypothetical protein FJ267_08705 [Planctomycetes bacterium]|nr:hypothetical protein [Planctomycetota bacterium]
MGIKVIWTSAPIDVPAQHGPRWLLELTERYSRNEFIEAWKQAGFERVTNPPAEADKGKIESAHRLDFVSQYVTVTNIHRRLRTEGESVELLGDLVRAYANPGDLVDFQ